MEPLTKDFIVAKLGNHPIFLHHRDILSVLLGGSVALLCNHFLVLLVCLSVLLGGSVAKEQAGWWSDVDLFVLLDPYSKSLSKKLKIDVAIELQDILKFDNVQVSIMNELPPVVQFKIFKNPVLLFVRDELKFQRYRERNAVLAIDIKIWQKRWLDGVLQGECT